MTREEAIEELLSMKHIFIAESDADKALDMAIEALQEQKKGKWRLLHQGKDTSDYECTNCLGILMDVPNDDEHELQKYCSMFGALMEGEEDG